MSYICTAKTTEGRAERRAEWFLRRMLKRPAIEDWQCDEMNIEVRRGVFSPVISRSTEFFARRVCDVVGGKRLVEIGSGSGAVAIFCALRGACHVVATDISSIARECTERNAYLNNVKHLVEVREPHDVLRMIADCHVVVFTLPYVCVRDVAPYVERYGPLAHSVFDERYETQREFFRMIAHDSMEDKQILVGFSSIGRLDLFHKNLGSAGLVSKMVSVEREGRADNRLYALRPEGSE